METRERKLISPDLDIFGDDNESEMGTEGRDSDESSMDIFGGMGDQESDTTEGSAAEEASETAEEAQAEGDKSNTETNTDEEAKTEEELNFDRILDELEKEAKDLGNSEMQSLLDELRDQNTDLIAENKIKDKQLEVLNEKLMGKTGDDTSMGMYKGIIDKLEQNPKIMMLAKFWGDDNEKIKSKLINILSDSIYDLTGEDVSDLINKTQSDKILAVTGGNASSEAPSFKNKPEDDENMDYESSIKDLF